MYTLQRTAAPLHYIPILLRIHHQKLIALYSHCNIIPYHTHKHHTTAQYPYHHIHVIRWHHVYDTIFSSHHITQSHNALVAQLHQIVITPFYPTYSWQCEFKLMLLLKWCVLFCFSRCQHQNVSQHWQHMFHLDDAFNFCFNFMQILHIVKLLSNRCMLQIDNVLMQQV